MNALSIPNFATAHNIEAEQALLGAIFINNEALRTVDGFLRPEHFYEPVHGHIYEICRDLTRAGKAATPVTLKTFLPTGLAVGGLTINEYLARLMAEATTIINAYDYGQAIYDLADRRQIAGVGQHLAESLQPDVASLAGSAIDELDAIVARRSETGSPALTMPQAAARAVDAVAGAYQRDGRISGLSWGLKDLDSKTLGLQRGEMVVLASRPGMGKSALALGVARIAAGAGHKSQAFSLEMGDVSMTQRMIADEIFDTKPLPYWQMRSGRLSEADFRLITEAAERLALLPIKIEQQSGLTLSQIAARARQLKRRSGLDLLIVDHLHLVKPSTRYAGNRVNEIGEVSSGLKALAKDLGIAVLALCQLSRSVEGRDDKRPTLADLRGSGDIEQDADTVVMLYRESYYLERAKPQESDGDKYAKWMADMERASNKLEAIIEKQRNGPIGSVELFCNIACNAIRGRRQSGYAAELERQEALAI